MNIYIEVFCKKTIFIAFLFAFLLSNYALSAKSIYAKESFEEMANRLNIFLEYGINKPELDIAEKNTVQKVEKVHVADIKKIEPKVETRMIKPIVEKKVITAEKEIFRASDEEALEIPAYRDLDSDLNDFVSLRAVKSCLRKALSLRGLKHAKKIGLLIIREGSLKKTILKKRLSSWHYFSQYIPVFGLFQQKNIAIWDEEIFRFDNSGHRTNTITRNTAIEDALVNRLVQSGRFNVIETIQPFYTQLEKLNSGSFSGSENQSAKKSTLSNQDAQKSSKSTSSSWQRNMFAFHSNPLLAAQIGKKMGVDTIIIGTSHGFRKKLFVYDSFWKKSKQYKTKFSMSLRTIDTSSGRVTSSGKFNGFASNQIMEEKKWFNIVYFVGQLAYIANEIR